MLNIHLTELDAALMGDILGGDALQASAFFIDDETRTGTNDGFHVVYLSEQNRGGIVLVGNGSSGETFWTDATSAGEVYARYIADDMRP